MKVVKVSRMNYGKASREADRRNLKIISGGAQGKITKWRGGMGAELMEATFTPDDAYTSEGTFTLRMPNA